MRKPTVGDRGARLAHASRIGPFPRAHPGDNVHIIRDFTAQSEGLEPEKSFGRAGLAIAGRLFSAWDDMVSGERFLRSRSASVSRRFLSR